MTSSVCTLVGVSFSSEISEISLFSSRVMSSVARAPAGFISGSAMVREGFESFCARVSPTKVDPLAGSGAGFSSTGVEVFARVSSSEADV